jgi:hypothetical protein
MQTYFKAYIYDYLHAAFGDCSVHFTLHNEALHRSWQANRSAEASRLFIAVMRDQILSVASHCHHLLQQTPDDPCASHHDAGCTTPPADNIIINGGTFTCPVPALPGDTCTYTCTSGTRDPRPNTDPVCQADGSWDTSAGLPTCTQCTSPGDCGGFPCDINGNCGS